MNKELKCQWNMDMSLDILRWYNIWPDTVEDGKVLLDYAYKYIEYFMGDGMERIAYNKSVIKNSFDKNYNI